ncbi:DUF4260 domain-containing protein [Flavobacterium sp. ZT3R17]|uniref:DUF4260 domain-containing protein n=1 Tax=Flavobacterium cryoconiti TaxID=3398736 RepID=UPI003A876A2F
MKTIIKLEELGLFVLGIYFFNQLDYAWWWFLGLILVPDLSMIGYVFGNNTGALCYNLFHHRGIAIALYLVGIYFSNSLLQLSGIMLFTHSSMDRMFGYGLKYETGFKYTHLGEIGKK